MNEYRRQLGRAATAVAALSVPLGYIYGIQQHRSHLAAFAIALGSAAALRGIIDLILRRMVAEPDLFEDDSDDARAEDALRRRRLFFWSRGIRWIALYALLRWRGYDDTVISLLTNPQVLMQLAIMPLFFIANFAILFGPMMMMGASQMKALEPGEADFGVRLDDVRGQKEAKEEIRKIITLWQSGSKFEAAGGKRERGILFLGAPGTGKTMLAKAIATGFNCPLLLMPGSGFAQTFIGMDAIIVRWMARRARKLAGKWGGQCIVFIDEIDAVGMRRQALAGGGAVIQRQMPGGMMGGMGQMGLNQLLVVMDGIDSPPFFRKFLMTKINLWLDALYFVPVRIKGKSLRLPKARPTGNQIYFVGATNVALEALDPALVRAGRMGRHIHFRQPTKRDREDILDLYLGKITHDDTVSIEELSRLTQGYSPADIEQVCSIALTYAHFSGRGSASRDDFMEAMVTNEAGTALGWGYESKDEEFSTAVHEAGHAACAHLFKPGSESTRLSIRRRGQTGGHHQAVETEERSFKNRDELFADLVWGLGAYAAEVVFFGNNTQGVGGDIQQASYLAGTMVGRWGMPPFPVDERPTERRLEALGKRLLASAGPNDVKLTPDKYKAEALLIGQAYLAAYNVALMNEDGIRHIADRLVRDKEVYGNDLVSLLDSAVLQMPSWDDYATCFWPE